MAFVGNKKSFGGNNFGKTDSPFSRFGKEESTSPFGGNKKSTFGGGKSFGGFSKGFNQQEDIDLFHPLGNQHMAPNQIEAIKALIISEKNNINDIIVKMMSEHESRTPLKSVVQTFAATKLQGCDLNIIYRENASMSPSFSIGKNIAQGGFSGSGRFGGSRLGKGLSVNGEAVDSHEDRYSTVPVVNKMNKLIDKFMEIVEIFKSAELEDPVEIRTSAALINYIPDTGNIILTPSTFIMNSHKNDAKVKNKK